MCAKIQIVHTDLSKIYAKKMRKNKFYGTKRKKIKLDTTQSQVS